MVLLHFDSASANSVFRSLNSVINYNDTVCVFTRNCSGECLAENQIYAISGLRTYCPIINKLIIRRRFSNPILSLYRFKATPRLSAIWSHRRKWSRLFKRASLRNYTMDMQWAQVICNSKIGRCSQNCFVLQISFNLKWALKCEENDKRQIY